MELRRKSGYGLSYDLNNEKIINSVLPYTMTQPSKINELIDAVRYIVEADISGSFVECGVWKGGSMMAAALTLMQDSLFNRDLFLFDTYSGMAEPSMHDVSLRSGTNAIDIFRKKERDKGGSDWCYASYDEVKNNMLSTGYPESKIHLVAGKVEDTIPVSAPDKISLLRLDTDWYESTLHELNFLYDRVQPGGILIIDDYDSWKGSRKAVDEFIEKRQLKLFLHRMGGKLGRIAVVP